jgi:hypothetical protein
VRLMGRAPLVLRMDNGPEFISHVLQQFCGDWIGICYIPPGTPWNNGHIESFNNRLRKECLDRNHWTSLLEARVVIEEFKDDHNHRHRHRHSSLGYLTPTEYAARCAHTHQPVDGCEIDWHQTHTALERNGPTIGDLPCARDSMTGVKLVEGCDRGELPTEPSVSLYTAGPVLADRIGVVVLIGCDS